MTDSPVPSEDDKNQAADEGAGAATSRSSARRSRGSSQGRPRSDPASRWIGFTGAGPASWAAADYRRGLWQGVTASVADSLRFVGPTQRLFEAASVAGPVGAAFDTAQSGSVLSGMQKVLEDSTINRAGSALTGLQASSVPASWQKNVAAAQGPLAAAGSAHRLWPAAGVGGAGSELVRSFERALVAPETLRTFEAMQASHARLFEQTRAMVGAFDPLAASHARIAEQIRAGFASRWKDVFDPTALQSLAMQQSVLRSDLGSALSGLAGFIDWQGAIGTSLFETAGRAVRAAERLGNRMFFAVVEAQQAVLAGDMDAVDAFFAEWTDLPRSRRRARVLAGSEVLLEVDFELWDPADGFELIEHVESAANRLFQRGRRPLTETTVNRQRIVSWESEREMIGNEKVDGQMPVSPSAEDRVLAMLNQFDGELAMALLGGLSPVDAQIAMARGFTASWDDAAQVCGLPASEGERVRAKLKRREQRLITITASRKRGR